MVGYFCTLLDNCCNNSFLCCNYMLVINVPLCIQRWTKRKYRNAGGRSFLYLLQWRSQHLSKRKLWILSQARAQVKIQRKKPSVIPLRGRLWSRCSLHNPQNPNPCELPRESRSVRICEDPPVCIPVAPRSVPTYACQPFSFLLRCVNFTVFVIFLFLGFMRTLTPRPSLPRSTAASQEPCSSKELILTFNPIWSWFNDYTLIYEDKLLKDCWIIVKSSLIFD